MLYAIEKNKAGRNFSDEEINWRHLFKNSEDSLTSFVFERLFYLPVELFWQLIKESCYGSELTTFCGPILSKEFWPHWDAEDTNNTNFIEPDVFIRFKEFDLIIEAKRFDDNQQNPIQWKDQITSYYKEYKEDGKQLFYIALGGLHSEKSEFIKEGNVWVVKCRWKRILDNVKGLLKSLKHSQGILTSNDSIISIFEDLVTVFQIHGYATGEWFDEIKNIESLKLKDYNEDCLQLNRYFKYKENE